MKSGAVETKWYEVRKDSRIVQAEIIAEASMTIYVNGVEFVTIMSSPINQQDLALGFLRNEDIVSHRDEVEHIHLSQDGCCVDVWLRHSVTLPERRIITSGCAGGVTFNDPSLGFKPIADTPPIAVDRMLDWFEGLQGAESLYARARGVHASGLADGEGLVAVAEDVGRHNTVDKLAGACLRDDINTSGLVLITTGRVSSEMMQKGARMGCPIVASRSSPTSLSIEMAEAWNITLVGYVRRGSMRIYTHPKRLLTDKESGADQN